MKFHIFTQGFPSYNTTLDWPELEENKDDSDKTEYIIFIKSELKKSFSAIFDEKYVLVMTEAEFTEYTKDD